MVNKCVEKMAAADGFVLASPVYFAGITGPLKSLLDRAYFVAIGNDGLFRHKVGAAAVAVRRAGSVTALDQLLKFFGISGMTVPGSNYWSMIYGLTPGEAAGDTEGRQCLRLLGENMAWLLKLIEHGKDVLPPPAFEEKVRMNFIR
jgi:multimeric flavodoxin WrbA